MYIIYLCTYVRDDAKFTYVVLMRKYVKFYASTLRDDAKPRHVDV